ncbi:sensor histidine kinase [Rugamonas rivuli]|uniref:histidine kinase n=1 Tax=Rugamonas rivuli TaxID=2743358 RepID=A0A843S790_9BURK|nr:ATP-binding protein [Rugamonas rivuli]MQA20069.1 sensor histidine kinase [Rugamonas rivuli]
MQKLKLNLGQPTLVRRVMLSLLAAFCLVWLVLMGRELSVAIDHEDFDRRVRALGDNVQVTLNDVQSEEAARTALAATSNLINQSYRDQSVPGILALQLSRADGTRIYLSPETKGTPLPTLGVDIGSTEIGGQPFRIHQRRVGAWTVTVAAQKISNWWILRRMGTELGVNMLIALPLVVLPLWFAVRRGLKPLQELSAHIVGKGGHDLTPLNIVPKYQELKPLATALDNLLDQLRRRVARETSFVHDAAHELRTPMAVISVQAHVLVKAQDQAQRDEAEQRMDHAIARASHLVQQLMEMAQLERGTEQGLSLQTLDAAQMARQAIVDLAPAAMERDIELSLEAPDALPHALDHHAFLSILHNLLHNAVRYIDDGGQVTVELARVDGALRLAVSDNGPGIPSAEQALVFERFYRCAGQNVSGSGLGLSIVQRAAQGLRGAARLEAVQPRGCRFVVDIPAA